MHPGHKMAPVENVKWAWPGSPHGYSFFVYLKMLLSLEGAASNKPGASRFSTLPGDGWWKEDTSPSTQLHEREPQAGPGNQEHRGPLGDGNERGALRAGEGADGKEG
ncbi:unnamed protein product [Boreogadus saida]